MSNNSNKNENKSMFLYTALIFAVALVLIIVAFFGQQNLKLKRDEQAQNEEIATEIATELPSELATANPTSQNINELAMLENTNSILTAENKSLKDSVSVYENLLAAYSYATQASLDNAQKMIDSIDVNKLSDDQSLLYNQIINIINERKEQ